MTEVETKHTILIVEDETLIAMSLKQKLITNGFNVMAVLSSGDEVLNFLQNLTPDLILMDIRLQGDDDGIEIAATVKKNYTIPVIFITAHSDPYTFQRAKRVEPYGYILKPVNEAELLNTIELGMYKFNIEKKAAIERKRYQALFENLYTCIVVYEAVDSGNDFIIKDINTVAEKTEHVKKEDVLNRTVTDVFPGILEFGLLDVLKRVYKTGQTERFPLHFYSDNRVSGWRDNFIYKLPTDEIVAVYQDMTKEKQIEEEIRNVNQKLVRSNHEYKEAVKKLEETNMELESANQQLEAANEELLATNEEFERTNEELISMHSQLEESRNLYQNLFHQMINAYAFHEFIFDDDGSPVDYRFIDLNKAYEKFTGLSREIIGKTARQVLKNRADKWIKIFGNVVTTGMSFRFEEYNKSSGLWLEIIAYRSEKNFFGTLLIDITERKNMMIELQEREERFRNTFEQAAVGIAHMGADGSYLRINRRFCDIVGYTQQEMLHKKYYDIIHPEYLDLSKKYINKVLKGFSDPVTFENEYFHKSGESIWVNVTMSALRDQNRDIKYFIVVVEDITERKQIEISLSNHETIVKTIQDVVSAKIGEQFFESMVSKVVDTLDAYCVFIGKLSFENEKYIQTLSLSVDGMIIENIQFALADTASEKVIENKQKLYDETNKAKYPGNKILTGTGVESHVGVPVIGSDNNCIGIIVAMFQNKLTNPDLALAVLQVFSTRIGAEIERLDYENTINNSLIEKEILLKEIHHRVKNNMQIISSLLNLQAYNIHDERDKDLFLDSQKRIRAMALVHERLYKSETLSSIDFNVFICELTREYDQTYSYGPVVSYKVDIDNIELTLELAVPCALLINELVINSLKHAFADGREGVISIYFKKAGDKKVLTVSDNGIGLPKNFNIEKVSSLGMQLICALAKQLQAELYYCSKKGTEFIFKFK